MSGRNFQRMLQKQWDRGNFVCVGLDSEFEKIPACAHSGRQENEDDVIIAGFNYSIVEATKDLVCAYKPNIAFYESHAGRGLWALQLTISYIRHVAPDVPVILDAKRAEIGNTNQGYATLAFDILNADAITVNPYFGEEALQPFLMRKEKGIIVLCRTSNPGAGEFQDLLVDDDGRPLYQHVAKRVANIWNKNGNCAIVVGATCPKELRETREIVGDMPILIPGVGAQGGDLEKTVAAGKDSRGQGMIINSSRGIIFASKGADFANAARRETWILRDRINLYR